MSEPSPDGQISVPRGTGGPVLIFDSGLGGLTVLRHVIDQMPMVNIVYCADNAGFSYANWEEVALVTRIVSLIGELVARFKPCAIVIACNTATTIALEALRTAFSDDGPGIPIVGTVPAIKVAAKVSQSRMFSVLATPGTVRRDYTKALIAVFAGTCDVTLVGVDKLSAIAEAKMFGQLVDIPNLYRLIKPAFVEKDGRRTDTIVLGCTHYPLIKDELVLASPWPVRFIDPAPAIARRLQDVLGGRMSQPAGEKSRQFVFTSAENSRKELKFLDDYGFEGASVFEFSGQDIWRKT